MMITNAQLDLIATFLQPINGMISALGIITNIINIIIFYKLRFGLTINYSLFILAVADFLLVMHQFVITTIGNSLVNDVLFSFSWRSLIYFVNPLNISYSTFGSWVQTVISVQRACCIIFPFKVTQMFETLTRR